MFIAMKFQMYFIYKHDLNTVSTVSAATTTRYQPLSISSGYVLEHRLERTKPDKICRFCRRSEAAIIES